MIGWLIYCNFNCVVYFNETSAKNTPYSCSCFMNSGSGKYAVHPIVSGNQNFIKIEKIIP